MNQKLLTDVWYRPKLLYWWPIGAGIGGVIVGVFAATFGHLDPTKAIGSPLCFFALFGLYGLHLRKCGVKISPEGISILSPTQSKPEQIRWNQVAGYRTLSWAQWRKQSSLAKRLLMPRATPLGYGGEQLIEVRLLKGRTILIEPFFQGHPHVIEAFKKMTSR